MTDDGESREIAKHSPQRRCARRERLEGSWGDPTHALIGLWGGVAQATRRKSGRSAGPAPWQQQEDDSPSSIPSLASADGPAAGGAAQRSWNLEARNPAATAGALARRENLPFCSSSASAHAPASPLILCGPG
ncbi:hypothetical protein ACCO45_010604 [Purpureocillium lilacinum]|uniref:Uncharacterized protein n=1 Tax=Purpureocillium lilacinum TaxID=33203 RepID=A0ACC4DFN1_PURLI